MLTQWVRDYEPDHPYQLPLEFVVRKRTANNTNLDGSNDRGRLAPGLRADLNLIALSRLRTHAPDMTYDLPVGMPRLVDRVEGYGGTWVGERV